MAMNDQEEKYVEKNISDFYH